MKQSLQQFWHSFTHLPSAWLLCLQLLILILSMLSYENLPYRAITWMLGVLVLLVIAKVIRQTPMFTILGLSFVAGAILFSSLIVRICLKPVHILVLLMACCVICFMTAILPKMNSLQLERYLPYWPGALLFFIVSASYGCLTAFQILTCKPISLGWI